MMWTFGYVPFTFLRQSGAEGALILETWKSAPVLNIRPLVSGSTAAIDQTGFTPWTLTGSVLVEASAYPQIQAMNGTAQVLSDGTLTWEAVGVFDLERLNLGTLNAGDSDQYVGSATFTRV